MASATMKCRVCGKEYEGCRSLRRNSSVFQWRSVACSPECGAKYLEMIRKSRGIVEDEPVVSRTPEPVVDVDDFDDDELTDENAGLGEIDELPEFPIYIDRNFNIEDLFEDI